MWLACTDPRPMLELLRGKASERKLRLFSFACMRRIPYCLPDDRWRGVFEEAEECAAGATEEEARSAFRHAVQALMACWVELQDFEAAARVRDLGVVVAGGGDVVDRSIRTARVAASSVGWLRRGGGRRRLSGLVRDLFGPLPFRRPALDPVWLAWDGGIIPKLAAAICEERAFDRLPVLADALEEAGCADEQILGHCRSGG